MTAQPERRGPARPPYLRWGPIGLVAIGGAVGAASREALTLVIPTVGEVPVSIAIINVVGAFFLGLLYEGLTRDSVSDDRRRRLKLLVGTGFCGGFTTYSSLATDTAVLNSHGHLTEAVVYALTTLVLGGLATWSGIVVAARLNGREASSTEDPR